MGCPVAWPFSYICEMLRACFLCKRRANEFNSYFYIDCSNGVALNLC